MDTHQSTTLVERALKRAAILRGQLPAGLAFHSDRGCPIHLESTPRTRPPSRDSAVHGTHRDLLRQRATGIVLLHTEARVLRTPRLAYQSRSTTGRRGLDRSRLQPASSPLITRLPQTSRERTTPTENDNQHTSRVSGTCPRLAVNPNPSSSPSRSHRASVNQTHCRPHMKQRLIHPEVLT